LGEGYLYEENPSDVEAALGASHCLTGTVSGRDPAALKGRDRGTKDFLVAWRAIATGVGAEAKGEYGRPRRCVWCRFPADTEQVTNLRRGRSEVAGASCPDQRKTKELFFQVSRCAPLTIRAIDGFGPRRLAKHT